MGYTMIQINLSMKRNGIMDREQTGGCPGTGVGEVIEWESRVHADERAFTERMDKQQDPIVDHRQLYSISYDNHNGKYLKELIYNVNF